MKNMRQEEFKHCVGFWHEDGKRYSVFSSNNQDPRDIIIAEWPLSFAMPRGIGSVFTMIVL
jgi:hypothetical protein